MAYFNKGPWKLCNSGIDVNCEAGIIATCDDPNTNQHFNACLIASAPEMYEALKDYLKADEDTNDKDSLHFRAKRAIAKAEGRKVEDASEENTPTFCTCGKPLGLHTNTCPIGRLVM